MKTEVGVGVLVATFVLVLVFVVEKTLIGIELFVGVSVQASINR